MAGLYYEEIIEGAVIAHDLRRTVTETDNLLFTTLTMNTQPLHLDAEFAAGSMYGQLLVNSIFTMGLTVGIPVTETTLGTTLGNLAFEEVSFPAPVFVGDTLRVETQFLSKRASQSRPDAGIVRFEHRTYKQDGTLVCLCRRAALMARKERGAA
ncbi:MaoC family dehydratase [Nocardioides humilatus]|uniref:MaoC family dehydratase n=1 Tax=Nocardioides humilatus TaxID=2607660 RepID=A0A5B1LBB8_9ACTN|nr:MaoC family dehydratase [Nocardioides humilatus]KAA1416967.1 MaoC family dehydratase [Nocardioides humilatus]